MELDFALKAAVSHDTTVGTSTSCSASEGLIATWYEKKIFIQKKKNTKEEHAFCLTKEGMYHTMANRM